VSAPTTKKIQSKKIVTLVDGYHLIFDDGDEAVRWQGGVLDSIFARKRVWSTSRFRLVVPNPRIRGLRAARGA